MISVVHISVNPWNEWGECSVTCGVGSKLRTRTCTTVDCQNTTTERCEKLSCGELLFRSDVNTHFWIDSDLFLSWSAWWSCSKSCGSGIKTRTRLCRPGAVCRAQDLLESDVCTSPPCGKFSSSMPMYARTTTCTDVYNEWQNWNACSTTCGVGLRHRLRTCQSNVCSEPRQTDSCRLEECPELGAWTRWSTCPVTCNGPAQRFRSRSCLQGNCPTVNMTESKRCENLPTCRKQVWANTRCKCIA